MQADPNTLIGVGIYTPAEAQRLTAIKSSKIRRWLHGHTIGGNLYPPLWQPQIDIGDDKIYLSFRDLTEVRVVDAFIRSGLSAQKVRRAIEIAHEQYGIARPLSTQAFRTDGKRVFLLLSSEGENRIVDIFRNQYAIREAIEPSYKGLEFNPAGEPILWRVAKGVVLDPEHAFGQPIEQETFVPTQILAAAAVAEGSARAAAKAYQVPLRAVHRAIAYEQGVSQKIAA